MSCVNNGPKAEQTFKNKHIKGAMKRGTSVIESVVVFLALAGIPATAASEGQTVTVNKPSTTKVPVERNWVSVSSTENVRCFCNLPQCVTTGYMCKSSGGVCFSDLQDHPHPRSSVYGGRHGCVELLPNKEQRVACQANQGTGSTRGRRNNQKLLFCCYHDLCNHADNPETKMLINNTLLGGTSGEPRQKSFEPYIKPPDTGYNNADVWFKAATIAVPICGAVILFGLIALAIKILRNEAQNSPDYKLGHSMYLHSPHFRSKNNFSKSYDHYDNMFCNEVLLHNTNSVYNSTVVDFQRNVHMPLVVQNETRPVCEKKKETNMHFAKSAECAVSNPDEEKAFLSAKYSESNLNRNVNISDSSCSDKLLQGNSVGKVYDKERINESTTRL